MLSELRRKLADYYSSFKKLSTKDEVKYYLKDLIYIMTAFSIDFDIEAVL